MQLEFGDIRLRQGNGNVQHWFYVQYTIASCQRHSGTDLQLTITSEVYFHHVLPLTQSALRGEEVAIAKKRKNGWSARVTGDFDSELLGDIFDDLDSEEIQLAFEVQDVLQERLTQADVNPKAREIIWEDGQRLSLRDSIQRLALECPQYPFEMLERQLTVWLEHSPPEYCSPAQLADYEALSERWLDDYAREFGFDR
jgi:hypothetical protein